MFLVFTIAVCFTNRRVCWFDFLPSTAPVAVPGAEANLFGPPPADYGNPQPIPGNWEPSPQPFSPAQTFSSIVRDITSNDGAIGGQPGQQQQACCAYRVLDLYAPNGNSAVHNSSSGGSSGGDGSAMDVCCDDRILDLMKNVTLIVVFRVLFT
jgi:hypothetical protein